ADPPPDPIGPPLYEHHAAWAPVQNTLYGDVSDLTIQLLSHDGELEVIATLRPETAATLESEFEAIAHGASIGEFDLGCLSFLDIDQVVLHVPTQRSLLTFGYPWFCPPTGLVTIDEILRDVVIAMQDCSPSPHLTSCEVVD
ncbi:MAG: hypothetical protein HC927_06500, partial [Deltaproteobacteria bacterium]|nr:hypothetical protein [Deltaproteobacteria bacterium]